MGYRIVYETGQGRREGNHWSKSRIWMLTVLFLLIFGIVTVRFWPEGREVLMDVLLPGDAEVTWQALETMTLRLRSGEAVGDAVMAFCREIIDGAQIAN